MPLYYLTLDECGDVAEDLEGIEYDNLATAHTSAVQAAREIMCGELKDGRLCLSCKIEVKDTSGAILMTVPFREAVTIAGL